jgi:hypothetical protein
MRFINESFRFSVVLFVLSLILAASGMAQQPIRRCATVSSKALAPLTSLPQADCTSTFTDPKAEYAPGIALYRIPVVVHIIEDTLGDGAISDALVQTQIDVLNEDFLALTGTPGEPGVDIQIEFYLATEDPGGSPTTGITRTTNDTWFADSGTYWNTLAWDTNDYLNVYTNEAGGALGYVPGFPQGGIVGSNSDRVVVYWAAFGRDAPTGPPYDQGRTLTHEVGHYLGLEHVFSGGCGSESAPGCYTNGDLICDTNAQTTASFGCPGGQDSCGTGGVDNISNYMDYSDDTCMNEFTTEQARRMRCSLLNWRPDLFELSTPSSPEITGRALVEVGDDVTLSIDPVSGATYQWKQDDVNVSGGTSASLLISPVALLDAGTYTVEIDDGSKVIYSSLPFELYVFPAGSLPAGTAAGLALLGGIAVSAATLRILRRRQK